MKILGIEKAVFSDDFLFIEVQLRTDQSQPLTLEFATDTLQDGLLRVWQALQSAGTDVLVKTNESQTRVKVVDARANPSDSVGVQLRLMTEQGIELHFSLGVDLSSKLRRKMKIAEEESGSGRTNERQ